MVKLLNCYIIMEIREYSRRDLADVLQITRLAWKPIYASFKKLMGNKNFFAFYPDWEKYKVNQMKNFLNDSSIGKCVAVVDEKVVGFVVYEVDEKKQVAEIHNNAVNPAYQGNGIGPRLYKYVFKKMKESGVKSVVVRTGGDASHAQARRAYAKAGFNHELPTVKLYRTL